VEVPGVSARSHGTTTDTGDVENVLEPVNGQ